MTISQTIVMIGFGSLLIQPVSGKGLLIVCKLYFSTV